LKKNVEKKRRTNRRKNRPQMHWQKVSGDLPGGQSLKAWITKTRNLTFGFPNPTTWRVRFAMRPLQWVQLWVQRQKSDPMNRLQRVQLHESYPTSTSTMSPTQRVQFIWIQLSMNPSQGMMQLNEFNSMSLMSSIQTVDVSEPNSRSPIHLVLFSKGSLTWHESYVIPRLRWHIWQHLGHVVRLLVRLRFGLGKNNPIKKFVLELLRPDGYETFWGSPLKKS